MRRPSYRSLITTTLLFLLALPLGSLPALAEEEVGIDAASHWVKREYGGKVLRAERLEGDGNTPVYRFKVLQNSGRVKNVVIDARTGRPPQAGGQAAGERGRGRRH